MSCNVPADHVRAPQCRTLLSVTGDVSHSTPTTSAPDAADFIEHDSLDGVDLDALEAACFIQPVPPAHTPSVTVSALLDVPQDVCTHTNIQYAKDVLDTVSREAPLHRFWRVLLDTKGHSCEPDV